VGLKRLPERFTAKLDRQSVFSHTAYNFDRLSDVCVKLAREAVLRAGGRVDKDEQGGEVWVIPVEEPRPGTLEQCWNPGPIAESRFTEEERQKIHFPPGER